MEGLDGGTKRRARRSPSSRRSSAIVAGDDHEGHEPGRAPRSAFWRACCSTVLIATNRLSTFGRLIASQIASASAASFLPRPTYGFTYCGRIRATSCPSARSSRADPRRRKLGKERRHVAPPQLTPQVGLLCLIDPAPLKNTLGRIQPNANKLAHGRLPRLTDLRQPHPGTSDAVGGRASNRPQQTSQIPPLLFANGVTLPLCARPKNQQSFSRRAICRLRRRTNCGEDNVSVRVI